MQVQRYSCSNVATCLKYTADNFYLGWYICSVRLCITMGGEC